MMLNVHLKSVFFVNVVAPGPVETDFGGGVVAVLCSDEAKWVNAQRIEVSGGMMI
jgi:NAD(P)-dependent dehydrogenase (short-subunit alcohol dehydrogenase family)